MTECLPNLTRPATPPAPTEGEVGELAKWLYRLADERTCNRRRGIRPHPSALTRAAALLEQLSAATPAVVPVAVSKALIKAECALAAAPEGEPSDQELYDYWIATSPELGCADPVGFARAVLARWGSPNQEQIGSLLGAAATPPAPLEGEVGELVAWLGVVSEQFRLAELGSEADQTDRAAALLSQLAAAAPANAHYTHWLPAHALPLPAPQGGEVEA